MKVKYIYSTALLCLMLLTSELAAQGLTIGTGSVFTLGSSTLSLSGNWSNSGVFNAGTGTVVFNNPSGNQTITNSSGETFNNIIVNKTSGDLQLINDVTLEGTLTLTSGDLDLNGHILTLGSSGTLSESAGNTVKGETGTITCTALLNTPSAVNPHSIGLEITSPAELGNTTIVRGHTAQSNGVNSGIKRYFEITPALNTSLNATVIFHFDQSELNALTESDLKIFSSSNSGSTWNLSGGIVNTTSHTLTLSGIGDLHRLTSGSSAAPLPVELSVFNASANDGSVRLSWKTATEVNNYGFEVERERGTHPALRAPLSRGDWEKIGFVKGYGNSNSPKEYSFTDDNAIGGTEFLYRLKQIDNDGHFRFYDALSVKVDAPADYKLMQNSPNPFNPVTTIKFLMPENSNVTIKVYDQLGREVAALLNEERPAGSHIVYWNGKDNYGQSVSSGVYLYCLRAGTHIETRKMNLLK